MPTVTIDGSEHEVDPSQVEYGEDEQPDGYLPESEVESRVQKRVERTKRDTKKALKNDDEFWREMAESRGIELRDDGKPKGSLKDEEVEELKRKASKAESLEEKVEEYEETFEETRRTQLHNKVLSSVEGVQEGAKEDLLMIMERRSTYDDEYGWVVTDDDGGIQYEAGEPVTPSDHVETLREKKPYLFKSTEMNGGPDDETGGSSGGGSTMEDMSVEERQKKLNRRPSAF